MYKFFLLFVLSLLCRYEIGCLMLSDFDIEMITFLVAVSRCLYCPTRCCIDFVMKKAFCSEKLPPNASEARSLGQSSLKPKVGKEASRPWICCLRQALSISVAAVEALLRGMSGRVIDV